MPDDLLDELLVSIKQLTDTMSKVADTNLALIGVLTSGIEVESVPASEAQPSNPHGTLD